MKFSELESRILEQVQAVVGLARMPQLALDLSLVSDIGMDSLELLEVVMLAEDEAGVIVGEEYFEAIETTGDLVFIVRQAAENRTNS